MRSRQPLRCPAADASRAAACRRGRSPPPAGLARRPDPRRWRRRARRRARSAALGSSRLRGARSRSNFSTGPMSFWASACRSSRASVSAANASSKAIATFVPRPRPGFLPTQLQELRDLALGPRVILQRVRRLRQRPMDSAQDEVLRAPLTLVGRRDLLEPRYHHLSQFDGAPIVAGRLRDERAPIIRRPRNELRGRSCWKYPRRRGIPPACRERRAPPPLASRSRGSPPAPPAIPHSGREPAVPGSSAVPADRPPASSTGPLPRRPAAPSAAGPRSCSGNRRAGCPRRWYCPDRGERTPSIRARSRPPSRALRRGSSRSDRPPRAASRRATARAAPACGRGAFRARARPPPARPCRRAWRLRPDPAGPAHSPARPSLPRTLPRRPGRSRRLSMLRSIERASSNVATASLDLPTRHCISPWVVSASP